MAKMNINQTIVVFLQLGTMKRYNIVISQQIMKKKVRA